MSFVKKIWKDRISQFPNRRTINDGYVTKQVTVGRDEGAVTEEGTPFDATEMNDLENRIYAAIEAGGGGGGGAGTFDYTELFNKPRINNHELDGNKSLGDLGIASSADELPIESGSATNTKAYIDGKEASLTTAINGKASKSLIDVYQSKSGSPAVIAGIGGYATVMVIGFAQGVGAVAILIKINNSAIASTIDLFTGQSFTSASLTFTYVSADFQLKINTTNANNSTFTVIKGGI